jgi:chorismate dehydratase
MLDTSDAALIIGDPALALSQDPEYRTFDLAELWRSHTGLGFIFAMWMTGHESCSIDFAAAREEGVSHINDIAGNYASDIGLDHGEMKEYLAKNISYSIDETMLKGMNLYFDLAFSNGLIASRRSLEFLQSGPF